MIEKLTDDNFVSVVKGASKPMLVLFMSSFCGPSHALFGTIDENVLESDERFTYAEVDVEKAPKMTKSLDVKGTPTLIWFHGGQPIGSRAGTMSDAFLNRFITEMLSRVKTDA